MNVIQELKFWVEWLECGPGIRELLLIEYV